MNGYRLLGACVAALAAMCCARSTGAIDPNRMISQYLREQWGSERGFTGGSVTAITQTPDGYLWIGTEKGLIRFDGVNFRPFPQASPQTFSIGAVQGLAVDAQGNLWIVLQNTRILRYHDGIFELGRDEAEVGITSAALSTARSALFSSIALGTVTYRDGSYKILSSNSATADSAAAQSQGIGDTYSSRLSWATGVASHRIAEPNSVVISMTETSDGTIWLGTRDKGLFYEKAGRISAASKGLAVGKINCLLALENGELWLGTDQGIVRWNGTELSRAGVPPALTGVQILAVVRDRDANIWLGTPKGLLRFNREGVSSLAEGGVQSASAVNALFEDREGDLWVGTTKGIERFRDSTFVTFTAVQGLPAESNGPVYVDEEERMWFAPLNGGLHWLKGGRIGNVSDAGLGKDVVYSITGSKNELWIGRQRGGLTRLRNISGAIAAQTYTQAEGLAQNSVYAVHQSADGAVWAGTLSGGVSELRNGRFITYTTADGLASNTVTSIAESADGTMWFATPNGLSSLSKSNWRTYKARDGLPSDDQNCLYEDSHGVLWAGTSAGLAFLRSGNVETLGEIRESLHEPILGIAEDKSGWLWISTSNHVLRVERDKLLEGVLSGADLREYSLADGLHGTEGVKRQQSVVADPRGRIWFSMNHGISVVDPVRAVRTAAPALVHVESVSADGTSIDLREPIRFPAARQRITISYEGLNLSAPERVSYRYRLEGFDHGWSEPVSAREAIYTNLSPGVYHFRVMASNSDGLWNDNPASVEFRMLPAYYQTAWFYFLCLVAAGGIGWASYQWRIQQMKARLDMQFEERLSERTRIAGELHDTLLQSFQGLTLHFQKVRNLLPERPAEAIQTLDRALNGAEQAIVEGREAILDIRSPAASENDLAQQIGSLGEELTAGFSNGESTKFRVLIEGASQTLHPFLQVEIYRIAREALRNAFGHAEAREIEAEITYGKKLFRLRIRDDGKGIDPDILHQGQRAGHLGLPGMRERAKRIGGKLDMWSEPRAGTEMELSIPSSIAYRPSDTRSGVQPFGKKNRADHDRKL